MQTLAQRFRRTIEGCRPKLSFRLCLFEDGFSFDLFGFLICLPFLDRWRYEPHEIMESWGGYYFERRFVWNWGNYYKSWGTPWEYTHIKVEVLRPDGSWVKEVNSWDKGEPDGRWLGEYSYTHTTKRGTVQQAIATVYVERREWRLKFLKWTHLFAKVRKSIDVRFNIELGDEAGSWKGGCIGCWYDMKKGESAEDTLRRMERERTFR